MDKWEKRGKISILEIGGGAKISYFGKIFTPGLLLFIQRVPRSREGGKAAETPPAEEPQQGPEA